MTEKLRADLSRAPDWATHYVHSLWPDSGSWWFVNIHTREWTICLDYSRKFHSKWNEEDIHGELYYWQELNVELENK